ncbi:hypothetical protein GGF41_004879, partial [Coemansia sp. RSA 2531]
VCHCLCFGDCLVFLFCLWYCTLYEPLERRNQAHRQPCRCSNDDLPFYPFHGHWLGGLWLL